MTASTFIWPTLPHRPSRFMRLLPGPPMHVHVPSTARWLAIHLVMIAVMLSSHTSSVLAQPQHGEQQVEDPFQPRAPASTVPPASPSGSSLPHWAEPRTGSSFSPGSRSDSDVPITKNGLGPPDNPNRVPLGGIEWLVLAGAGYGVFRLRKAEENR